MEIVGNVVWDVYFGLSSSYFMYLFFEFFFFCVRFGVVVVEVIRFE